MFFATFSYEYVLFSRVCKWKTSHFLFFHALSQAVILYFPFQTLKVLNKYILVNQCNQLDKTNLYNLKT